MTVKKKYQYPPLSSKDHMFAVDANIKVPNVDAFIAQAPLVGADTRLVGTYFYIKKLFQTQRQAMQRIKTYI